jgi:hypothetical protein
MRDTGALVASEAVMELIGKQLFGSFVRLKNKRTGEEALVPYVTWITNKDGSRHLNGKMLELDAVIPDAVHLYETSRQLHAMSTRRIIDPVDKDREWEEVASGT